MTISAGESRALRVPAAEPAVAAGHFAAVLRFDADPDDVARDLADQAQHHYRLVETRAPAAFDTARIPGAINLPYRDVTDAELAALDPSVTYICYCESDQCNAAVKGALRLAEYGLRVKRLAGGIRGWLAAGYPAEGTGVSATDQVPGPIACAC